MKLTAAICTSGERDTLEGSLQTLTNQDPIAPVDFEVVVVDNSRNESSFVNRSVERCASGAAAPIRVIRESRVGLGYARNRAIEAAEGGIVAFLDDDVVVDPFWASELVKAYQETDADAVGGMIYPVWLAERPSWLGDELLAYLSLVDYGPGRRRCRYPKYPFGANISFKKNVLLEIGGFATSLGGGGAPTYLMDEIDLCRRLERTGRLIVYAPAAKVGHIIPASRLKWSYFIGRALILGRATARMGCQGSGIDRYTHLKGFPLAAIRVLRHGVRAGFFAVAGRKRELLSEERHVVWNLAWLWETGLIAVKG